MCNVNNADSRYTEIIIQSLKSLLRQIDTKQNGYIRPDCQQKTLPIFTTYKHTRIAHFVTTTSDNYRVIDLKSYRYRKRWIIHLVEHEIYTSV
jgi:hypothetical protein